MRLFGVPLTKRETQFVPSGLGLRLPQAAIRQPIWGDDVTGGLTVVHACLHVLTQRLAAMPIRIFDMLRIPHEVPLWLQRPSPGVTGADLICSMAVSLAQRGNAYLLPVRGTDGQIVEVFCAAPDQVRLSTTADGAIDYWVAGQKFDGEIVHVRYIALPGQVLGLSAWGVAERAVEIGVASEDFVRRHFEQSAHLQMAVVAKGTMTGKQKTELAAQIRAHHVGEASKAWTPLVLDGDVDVRALSMTAEQAQFVELTRMTAAQIASQVFRIDPSLVGIQQSGTTLTYANLQDREAQLYQDAIRPLAIRIEQTITSLLHADLRCDLDARDLLSGSPRERVANVVAMKQTGAFTVNELRERLGYPAIEEGDALAAAPGPSIVVGNDFPQLPATDDDEAQEPANAA